MNDYADRNYLSAIEASKFLEVPVSTLHHWVKSNSLKSFIATSGQQRFSLSELKNYQKSVPSCPKNTRQTVSKNTIEINGTTQTIYIKNAMKMDDLPDNSVNLIITSPPYFDAKMYAKEKIEGNLGDIHDLNDWFEKIGSVWQESYRVLQPGRKIFINIMNLPIRDNGGFKSLNLSGKTIDLMEKIGFIFKRDIIWHKTNGVRANFGTYPYPGGILINNMHEFILEFNKPDNGQNGEKYKHISTENKEASKIDKNFWLSIKNTDVWLMKPQGSSGGRSHVAPFPYELPYRIIKAFTYIGETILDPFLGSGTALKAAADLKRNGVGYEIVSEIATDTIKNLNNYQSNFFKL